MLEPAYGERHPLVASTLTAIGGTHYLVGDFELARGFQARSVQISLATLGPDHPTVATDRLSLAATLMELGRFEDALAHSQASLAAWEKLLGPNDPNLAGALVPVGRCLIELDRAEDAAQPLRRAVRLLELAKAGPVARGEAQSLLARALWSSDPVEARGLMAQAVGNYLQAGSEGEDALAEIRKWTRLHGG
jgi:tetratricopeptide (TPR) repeat protein